MGEWQDRYYNNINVSQPVESGATGVVTWQHKKNLKKDSNLYIQKNDFQL